MVSCDLREWILNVQDLDLLRGTPNRGQGRGNIPAFNNSPASNIPRPTLESHGSSAVTSEAGGSTMSASRAKQSKRDEVGRCMRTHTFGY